MSDAAQRLFGEGPLSRVMSFIYTMLVVEVALVLASLPGVLLLTVLDRDATNLPLVAVFSIPFGPAMSAALYALRRRSRDMTDLKPWRDFWHGYRLNFKGALQIWTAGMVWLALLAIGLTWRNAVGLASAWTVAIGVVMLFATLWLTNALVITSLFTFRARDVARLAAYFLGRTRVATLGNAGIVAIAVVITLFANEFVVGLLGSVLALMLLTTNRPMVEIVTAEFTK
jgi:uncharacterized membrane protein YesL